MLGERSEVNSMADSMADRIDVKGLIEEFLKQKVATKEVSIYNEFSLQHELGIYLREALPKDYKVEFERNIRCFDKAFDENKYVKKEIDIVIYKVESDKDYIKAYEKYAIELKYPRNGQYPEQMYKFIQDIKFMEQAKKEAKFDETFCLTVADDSLFWENGKETDGIYKYFRNPKENPIEKTVGYKGKAIDIDGKYNIEWKETCSDFKYYIVETYNE